MGFTAARESAGYSQGEVAKLLGVDQSAISQWETGRTLPRATTLVRLAGLYLCSIDELMAAGSSEAAPPRNCPV